jgi:hypothetical protein
LQDNGVRSLSVQKPDKNLPALKELTQKASLQDIVDEVDSVFRKQVLGNNGPNSIMTKHSIRSRKMSQFQNAPFCPMSASPMSGI